MSHSEIALVWEILHGRKDIGHILREIVGNHALDISLARRDNTKLREAFFSHIITLRLILDLQRTYLQSAARSAQSDSSILPPELLFSAVLHLLDVIVAGSTSCPDLSNENPYNRLTLYTTLAGLRTLLLRRASWTTRDLDLLSNRFEEISERGHWHGTTYATTIRLCRQVIQCLTGPSPPSKYTGSACGEASLPDFYSGLYRYQNCQQSIIDASRRIGTISLQSTEWFHQLLTLYDLLWSTTAALNQLCLVRRRTSNGVPGSATGDQFRDSNDLRLVLSTKYQLRKHAHVSSVDLQGKQAAAFLDLMLQDICVACAEEKCQCFQADSGIIQEVRLQHGMQPCQGLEFDASAIAFESTVTRSIQHICRVLQERSSTVVLPPNILTIPDLQDYDTSTISDVSTDNPKTKQAITSPQRSPAESEQPLEEGRPRMSSAISSPPVSKYNSAPQDSDRPPTSPKSRPHNTNSTTPNRHPSDRSSNTNGSYPGTTTASEVFSYRSPPLSSVGEDPSVSPWKVDVNSFPEVYHPALGHPSPPKKSSSAVTIECFPEVYTPDVSKERPDWERSQSWQPDLNNHPEVVPSRSLTITTMAPSIMSQESDDTSLQFRPETAQAKPKRWQGLFGATRTNFSLLPPSFVFFASGQSLLLWSEAGARWHDLHDAESIQFRRINASKVCTGAGGHQRCALIVKGVSEYRLEVYEGACDVPLRHWKMDSLPYALAVSKSDNFIAAKFSRTAKIFRVDTGEMIRHELPPSKSRSGRGNQLIAFSSDSLSFSATTRYEPEKVVTYWSECCDVSKATVIESTAPTGFPGDCGLSSLLCSSTQTRAAFLATFTEKAPPAFLSLKPQKSFCRPIRDSKGRIGTRIHSAALCPLGISLVLLNQRNDVFWVEDCWTGTQEPRRVGTIKRSVGVMKEVEVGMPNSEEVHLFWLEKGKGILVTMGKGGGKSKPIELSVDLSPG